MAEGATRVSAWRRPWVADALMAGVVVVYTVGTIVGLLRPDNVTRLTFGDVVWGTALSLPFPIVGYVIARRIPSNPIGWLFLIGPLTAMAGIMASEIVNQLQTSVPRLVPFFGDTLFFIGVGLMAGLFLVLFPTGRVPSHRWRWVVSTVFGGLVLNVIWSLGRECINWVLIGPEGHSDIPTCSDPLATWFLRFDNPFTTVGDTALWDVLGAIGSGMVLLAAVAGAISLFVRRRSASAVERAQLRWLLLVVMVVFPLFGLMIGLELVAGFESELFSMSVFIVGMAGIPVGIGLGIMRYRLYEIDRIVSRTVSYGIVAVVLAASYGAVVMIPTVIMGEGSGETPPLLVAVTTLALFALVAPLRRRVQHAVDKRFDRARYDAQRVADGFGLRVRDLTDRGLIERELAGAADGALRPSFVSTWLRDATP